MHTLIIAEHDNKILNPSTYSTVTAALHFKQPITLLILGAHCAAVCDSAAMIAGVDTVWLLDHTLFANQLADHIGPMVMYILSMQSLHFTTILAPATTFGKACLPYIAAKLDVAQYSDVVAIIDEKTVVKPIYAGNAIQTLRILEAIKVMTIRPTVFAQAAQSVVACDVVKLDQTWAESIASATKTHFVSSAQVASLRPDLSTAKRVVSGGRGLQSAENFQLINKLADALDAAVGASRAAVDAGFITNEHQVGQTGTIVAPELYIAVGISGAIQHISGMKDSKVIVAINHDPDAPMVHLADYSLIGDLFTIVPELTEKLQQRKGK